MHAGSDESVDEPRSERVDSTGTPVDAPVDAGLPLAPVTGDPAIDDAMARLARAQGGSAADRIDAGERAHRMLQERLSDLGGA